MLSIILHPLLMFSYDFYSSLQHKVSLFILTISIFPPSWSHALVFLLKLSKMNLSFKHHPLLFFFFFVGNICKKPMLLRIYKVHQLRWLFIPQSLFSKNKLIFLTILMFCTNCKYIKSNSHCWYSWPNISTLPPRI